MKRKHKKIVNYLLLAALLAVAASGILLHRMGANMWLGITHGVSGYLLIILGIIHVIQHRKTL